VNGYLFSFGLGCRPVWRLFGVLALVGRFGRMPPVALPRVRGGQYAGDEYRAVLARARMEQSMSRPDDCYDNAFMESCFGTIKTELEMGRYADLSTARQEIRAYLAYYDTKRRHSALGYLTPYKFGLSQ
jgi:transposase InsO family protein